MNLTKKSRVASLILTVLLGPLGLMYSTAIGGFVMLILMLLTAWTVAVPIGLWILCVAIGDHKCHRHNQGIDRFTKLMTSREIR